MTPTSGLASARTYLARILYDPDVVRRLLEHWALWHAGGEAPGKPFEEGGAIERLAVATEGGFAALARQYGDIGTYVSRLRQPEQAAVILKWRHDLTKYQIARQLRRNETAAWDAAWKGTEWLLEMMTRQPGMNTYVIFWRESLHMKRAR